MLFPDDGSEVLSTVVSSSCNRVPKQNTDRTISSEGRFCHDLRFPVNEYTDKSLQPRVVLSTHAEVARAVLRLEARYPGISRAITKRDVKAAFKLIWVHPGDVEVLATDLPGDGVGLPDALVAVFLVLTFGWTGSPGAWQVWAEALRVWHSSRGSAEPDWDGPEAFDSFMVVDDGAIVEPDLGRRQELSAQAWEDGLSQLLGPKALNLEKLEEEGAFLPEHILWGLTTNVNTMTFSLPEHKIARAQFVMDDPVYDPGRRRILVRDLQVLRGNAQHWSLAQPRLKPELAAIDRMLTGVKIDQEWVQDRSDTDWEEFEDTVEYMRVLVGCPHLWISTFRSSFAQVLSPAERWSLPNGPAKVWTGGDATKERVGFTDWTAAVCFSESVAPFMAVFRQELGPAAFEGEEDVIIALCELLAIVLGTLRQKHEWRDKDVIYVSDNSNVVSWLRSRRTPHRWARYMLRMLTRIEINFEFSVVGVYIRTAHSTFNDDLTRIDPSLLAERASEEGVALVHQSTAILSDIMNEGWMKRVASFPGAPPAMTELATRLRDRRVSRGAPATVAEAPPGLTLHAWRTGPGGICSAASPAEKRWLATFPSLGSRSQSPDIAVSAALSLDECMEGIRWVSTSGARVVCVSLCPRTALRRQSSILDYRSASAVRLRSSARLSTGTPTAGPGRSGLAYARVLRRSRYRLASRSGGRGMHGNLSLSRSGQCATGPLSETVTLGLITKDTFGLDGCG